MPELETTTLKPPQISNMLQKFALAFKTKTIEFFAEEEDELDQSNTINGVDDGEDFTVLDSSEEIITAQKVVVIKPDQQKPSKTLAGNNPDHQTLISTLFATISAFEASYLHLQTAHAPFDVENIKAADRAAVSHLQRLSEIKNSFTNICKNPNPNLNLPLVSHLEAQVQENQSLLRSFDMIINRLQSDIDRKDDEVLMMKQRLEKIAASNAKLTKRLKEFDSSSSPNEVLLSFSLFQSVYMDACRSAHSFTKTLIGLMKKAGWDLDSAANSVHPDINYAKRGHNRYAFLSYVCLEMFLGFDLENFGIDGDEIVSNGHDLNAQRKIFMALFVEYCSFDAMELLSRDPDGDFARFCEKKYQQLIGPNMESSLFRNMDQREFVLNSTLYELFVNMASSIWVLHKFAFSFDPTVGIFQVGRGVDFSMVYMENVARRAVFSDLVGGKTRAKVGFTVIPGFRVGHTMIQCQVYLTGIKYAE